MQFSIQIPLGDLLHIYLLGWMLAYHLRVLFFHTIRFSVFGRGMNSFVIGFVYSLIYSSSFILFFFLISMSICNKNLFFLYVLDIYVYFFFVNHKVVKFYMERFIFVQVFPACKWFSVYIIKEHCSIHQHKQVLWLLKINGFIFMVTPEKIFKKTRKIVSNLFFLWQGIFKDLCFWRHNSWFMDDGASSNLHWRQPALLQLHKTRWLL